MAAGLQDCADAGIDCTPELGNVLLIMTLGPVAVAIWIVAAAFAGFSLINVDMSGRRRALWGSVIVLIPFLGALAWFSYRLRDGWPP